MTRSVAWLRNRAPVDASLLYSMVEADPIGSLLRWNADPAELERMPAAERGAFRNRCAEDYGVDVDGDGVIEAAAKLAHAKGPWRNAWLRFREAPTQFGGVVERLRQAGATSGQGALVLGLESDDPVHAWPQFNEGEEADVRSDLESLADSDQSRSSPNWHRSMNATGGDANGSGPASANRRWPPALQHLVDLAAATEDVKQGSVAELVEWHALAGEPTMLSCAHWPLPRRRQIELPLRA